MQRVTVPSSLGLHNGAGGVSSRVMGALVTPRLDLVPMTLAIVEAVMLGDREGAERAAGLKFPEAWPGRALVERAFSASLERIREDPERRLWGDRLLLLRDDTAHVRTLVGSVVFHGRPDDDGIAEIGYGVDEAQQGKGYATEAVRASVAWAFEQGGTRVVRATTLPWHVASIRVLEKVGMARVGTRDHEMLGELVVYETSRPPT